MFQRVIAFAFFFIVTDAFACRPVPIDYQSEIQKAKVVAIRTVTGVYSPELESSIMGNIVEDIEVILVPIPKSIRVVVTENIKGALPKVVDIAVGRCSSFDLSHSALILDSENGFRAVNISGISWDELNQFREKRN